MKNRNLLAGVCAFAIAGALTTLPAHADNESDADSAESTDESVDARIGVFAKSITSSPFSVSGSDFFGSNGLVETVPRIEMRSAASYSSLADLNFSRVSRAHNAIPVGPNPEIIARDDVGIDGTIDVGNTQPSVVQLFLQDNTTGGVFFNCTGTMINPRTVLTAAHCLNADSSEAYGLPGAGSSSVLISSGVDTSTRLFNYLGGGLGYNEGGVATSTDVIIHPSSNIDDGALPFPWADVALVALDAPVTDIPAMPILMTPLTELTHVTQVGYGGFGTAATGDVGIGFLRRVGENMLGALASPADLIDTAFSDFAPSATVLGFESQAFYFTDFDNPDRTPEQQAGCDFNGSGINCVDLDAVLAIDWFDGDALPNEVATAPGDSGGPLIADQLNGPPVIIGVLSGGFDFFGIGNTYGDVSFYNPIFPFFEFISENTSYKYVSAKRGSGVWSDPDHWTQDLDPGFLVQDGPDGLLVNALPEGPEPGVYETGPKLGNILGVDISGNADLDSIVLPPEGTPNFGGNIPESSALLGPGSTGFVPNNTDGTPGTSFSAPAQYFDVILSQQGRTTVDIDVEIDRLTLDNPNARLEVPEGLNFTSIIGYEQFNGRSFIDGSLNTGLVALSGGRFEGTGTVSTNAFFNLAGELAPAGIFKRGTLTIDGDYVQASGGSLLSNARFASRGNTADLLSITGDASLAGNLVVSATGRPEFGDEVTVLSANSILGDFDDVFLVARSSLLFADTRVEGSDVIVEIDAVPFADVFTETHTFSSLGLALDALRFNGRYAEFSDLFGVIDSAGVDTLMPTLSSLTPVSAFDQTFTANAFSSRFTGQISQRTLSLRGGSRAEGGFTAAGDANYALAGNAPTETGQMGFFGTVSGAFLNASQQPSTPSYDTFGTAFLDTTGPATGSQSSLGFTSKFDQVSLTEAGEITLGADMAVSEGLRLGFAISNVRNSQYSFGDEQLQADLSRSVAVFASYTQGDMFADGYIGSASQRYGVDREVQGDFRDTAISNRAIGETKGLQNFGGMRVGYAMEIAKGLEIGPVASMDYSSSQIAGYDEFSTGAFGLAVAERTFTSVGAKAGAMASFDVQTGKNSSFQAFGSVAYAQELADTADIVTANFFGAEDTPFSIANQLDPQWVSLNAGAEMRMGDNLTAAFSITSDMGRGPLSNERAQASVSWRF